MLQAHTCDACGGIGLLAEHVLRSEDCTRCAPQRVKCPVCQGHKKYIDGRAPSKPSFCTFCDEQGMQDIGSPGVYLPPCRACRGKGVKRTAAGATYPCAACKGTGKWLESSMVCGGCRMPWNEVPPAHVVGGVPRWDYTPQQLMSDAPSGKGKRYRYEQVGLAPCPHCSGTGEERVGESVLPDSFELSMTSDEFEEDESLPEPPDEGVVVYAETSVHEETNGGLQSRPVKLGVLRHAEYN